MALTDNAPVILGSGQVPFRRYRDGSGFRDWVRLACDAAFDDAQVDRAEIDAVVVASESDMLSMQLSPGPMLVDDIGLTGVPVVRVEAGGGSGGAALRMAVMHILSGLARRVLVVGFEAAASHLPADTVRSVYGLSFDADLEGWAGATGIAQAITVSRLIEGRHHAGLQPARDLRTGLIDCHGGLATVNLTHVPQRFER